MNDTIKMEYNKVYDWLIVTLIIFSFTTITYSLWPSYIKINRISGVFIILELFYTLIIELTGREFIICSFTVICCLMSIIFAKDQSQNLNDMIYWVTTTVFLLKLGGENFRTNLYTAAIKNINLIKINVYICDLSIIIGLFFKTCYVNNWGSTYYVGFGYEPHAFCSGICIIMVLTFFILSQKGNVKLSSLLLFIPGMTGILYSGARTYIIALGVILAVYYIYYIKRVSIKLFLIPVIVLVSLYILIHSNMIQKFVFTYNNTYTSDNSLVSFTNGRLDFESVDLEQFNSYNLFNKLFGNGFDYVYDVNEKYVNARIWAHNDYIDLLLSVGLIGTTIYIYLELLLIKIIYQSTRDKLLIVLYSIYMVGISLLNGLFTYQHFLYSVAFLTVLLTCSSDITKKTLRINT